MTAQQTALAAYITVLERFDERAVDELCALVTDDVRFVDPFNDTTGIEAFRTVFCDARAALTDVHFRVTERAWNELPSDSPVALLRWQLDARLVRLGGRNWHVSGCSTIHFDAAARVCAHHDYWDPAGQLYELLPLIGAPMRWLRRRLRST